MPEYAFDVQIQAVIRVKADTVEEASETLQGLQSASLDELEPQGCTLTEFSVWEFDKPFEIDGVEQD